MRKMFKGLLCLEYLPARIAAGAVGRQAFFDSNQAIVLRYPIGARHGSGFDLPGRRGDGEIGNSGVLGFDLSSFLS